MIRQLRLILLMGVVGIIACGVFVFCTHRTAHGTTAEERAAYESGEKAGREAASGATLPTQDELNMTAQKYFEQQGSVEQFQNPSRAETLEACKRAFKKGYTAGFKKTHSRSSL
jgi:hypothetical protein